MTLDPHEDDLKRRESLLLYVRLLGGLLSLCVLATVLYIFLKQAQIMDEISGKVNEMIETMPTPDDNGVYENDYTGSDYNDYTRSESGNY